MVPIMLPYLFPRPISLIVMLMTSDSADRPVDSVDPDLEQSVLGLHSLSKTH